MSEEWVEIENIAYPRVERFYPIDDEDAEEHVRDAPALIRIIYERVRVEASLIRDPEVQRDLRVRTAHYIFARIVRLGVFLAKRDDESGAAAFDDSYRDQLKALLDADDETFARIFYLGSRIARYVHRAGGALTQAKVKRVRRFAETRLHNCTFCGVALEYSSDKTSDDSFEIEHLFAQAIGGTDHRTNLAAACNRCNKLKADRISFVDFYHESFAVVSDNEDVVSPEKWPHVILALLMKQHGQCFHCERQFYLISPQAVVLARRELDDYYHFRNCYVACRDCGQQLKLDGIEVAVPLRKGGQS